MDWTPHLEHLEEKFAVDIETGGFHRTFPAPYFYPGLAEEELKHPVEKPTVDPVCQRFDCRTNGKCVCAVKTPPESMVKLDPVRLKPGVSCADCWYNDKECTHISTVAPPEKTPREILCEGCRSPISSGRFCARCDPRSQKKDYHTPAQCPYCDEPTKHQYQVHCFKCKFSFRTGHLTTVAEDGTVTMRHDAAAMTKMYVQSVNIAKQMDKQLGIRTRSTVSKCSCGLVKSRDQRHCGQCMARMRRREAVNRCDCGKVVSRYEPCTECRGLEKRPVRTTMKCSCGAIVIDRGRGKCDGCIVAELRLTKRDEKRSKHPVKNGCALCGEPKQKGELYCDWHLELDRLEQIVPIKRDSLFNRGLSLFWDSEGQDVTSLTFGVMISIPFAAVLYTIFFV